MIAHGMARGWRVAVCVELERGPSWQMVPPHVTVEGSTHPGLSYTDARALAAWHSNAGRRARIVDPEGRSSGDVLRVSVSVNGWGLTMG